MIQAPTALLQELVQTSSVSGSEGQVADLLLDLLADTPFTTTELGNTIVAHHDGDGPLIMLHAHIDTVPAEGDWEHPPTGPDAGVIEDGLLYGLGAADNKASVVSVLLAAGELLDHDCQPVLIFAAEEEVSGAGTQQALDWLQDQYDTDDAMAIVTEPTGLTTIGTGCMGTLFLELEAAGTGGHAAMDTDSPITAVQQAVTAIDAIDGATPTLTSMDAGSDAPNQVPDQATATVDVRLAPGTGPADVMDALDGADTETDITATQHSEPCPAAVCDDEELIAAAKAVTGADSEVLATSDDSCFLNQAGIPTIVYGPGEMAQAHAIDEHVDPQKVQKAAKDLVGITEAWTQ